jgi:hypothetical protein
MQRVSSAVFAMLVCLPLPGFAANEGGPPPACIPQAPADGKPWVCKAHHNWRTNLVNDYTRILDLTTDICVNRQSHVHFHGFLNLVHNGTARYPDGSSAPVGWGVRISKRSAQSRADFDTKPPEMSEADWNINRDRWNQLGRQWVTGSQASGNITDVTERFKEASLAGYQYLAECGCHRFEVWGHNATVPALAPGGNMTGLISVNRSPDGSWTDTFGFLAIAVTPLVLPDRPHPCPGPNAPVPGGFAPGVQ